MTSNTDLPHQPDTLQQPPPLMKKKSSPIWRITFILLLICNSIFLGPFLLALVSSGGKADLGFIMVILYVFIFSIIDFVPVLLYIITQNPQGIAKIISYTALTVISLALVAFGFGFIDAFIPGGRRALDDITLYFVK
jgi:hypothetical protein